MSDIERGGGENEIILKNDELLKNYLQIQINEKQNQILQLKVNLDRINTVEINKLLLAQKRLQKEIEGLMGDLRKLEPMEAEIVQTNTRKEK